MAKGLESAIRRNITTIVLALGIVAILILSLILKEVTDSNRKVPTITYDQVGLVEYQACLQSLDNGSGYGSYAYLWATNSPARAACKSYLPVARLR